MKLKHIHEALPIEVSPETMWQILSHYGDVGHFHAGVVTSHKEAGSENRAALGCERVCNIVDLGLQITLKERIINFDEGHSYQYEVYEWKNFPIGKMLFGFSIYRNGSAGCSLAIDIEYVAKPTLLTPLLAGKMRKLARDVLLGYKHYAETGETRTPIKQLKQRYKSVQPVEVQYG